MFPAGFEPAIPASQRPQTHVSECAATWIGVVKFPSSNFMIIFPFVFKNGVQATKVDDHEKCQIYISYSLIITQPTNALIVCHLF